MKIRRIMGGAVVLCAGLAGCSLDQTGLENQTRDDVVVASSSQADEVHPCAASSWTHKGDQLHVQNSLLGPREVNYSVDELKIPTCDADRTATEFADAAGDPAVCQLVSGTIAVGGAFGVLVNAVTDAVRAYPIASEVIAAFGRRPAWVVGIAGGATAGAALVYMSCDDFKQSMDSVAQKIRDEKSRCEPFGGDNIRILRRGSPTILRNGEPGSELMFSTAQCYKGDTLLGEGDPNWRSRSEHPYDLDGDYVSDDIDECLGVSGLPEKRGCPDPQRPLSHWLQVCKQNSGDVLARVTIQDSKAHRERLIELRTDTSNQEKFLLQGDASFYERHLGTGATKVSLYDPDAGAFPEPVMVVDVPDQGFCSPEPAAGAFAFRGPRNGSGYPTDAGDSTPIPTCVNEGDVDAASKAINSATGAGAPWDRLRLRACDAGSGAHSRMTLNFTYSSHSYTQSNTWTDNWKVTSEIDEPAEFEFMDTSYDYHFYCYRWTGSGVFATGNSSLSGRYAAWSDYGAFASGTTYGWAGGDCAKAPGRPTLVSSADLILQSIKIDRW